VSFTPSLEKTAQAVICSIHKMESWKVIVQQAAAHALGAV
jgi:hypothetical protein